MSQTRMRKVLRNSLPDGVVILNKGTHITIRCKRVLIHVKDLRYTPGTNSVPLTLVKLHAGGEHNLSKVPDIIEHPWSEPVNADHFVLHVGELKIKINQYMTPTSQPVDMFVVRKSAVGDYSRLLDKLTIIINAIMSRDRETELLEDFARPEELNTAASDPLAGALHGLTLRAQTLQAQTLQAQTLQGAAGQGV